MGPRDIVAAHESFSTQEVHEVRLVRLLAGVAQHTTPCTTSGLSRNISY